jgi:hypothetical protein
VTKDISSILTESTSSFIIAVKLNLVFLSASERHITTTAALRAQFLVPLFIDCEPYPHAWLLNDVLVPSV